MRILTENNEYYYDNFTGLILPNYSIINSILNLNNWDKLSKEEVMKSLGNDFNEKQISFYYEWLKKYKFFCENRGVPYDLQLDKKTLKHYLLKNGFNQLILSITEDCNFRCSYCIYSDQFKNSRNHSLKYMSFEIAKKAVDIYLKFFCLGKTYNLFKKPTFSFYGGEPLLNFDLIRKVVNYVNSKYLGDVQFTITTNGSLLDKQVADYLIKNNFSILISLDGNEEEHNRKRKYKNNGPTFKDIFNNVAYLLERGYDKIFMVPVFDWKTNFEFCEHFFEENNLKVLSVSQVDEFFTDSYYSNFSDEDFNNFNSKIKKLKENYVPKDFKYSYLFYLIEYPIVSTILDSNLIHYTKLFHKFTSSCIPGEKIYVNVDGEFHMCERVSEIKQLGDVFNGINFDNILNIILELNSKLDFCNDCEVSFICKKCFRSFMVDNEFKNSSEICSNVYFEIQRLLEECLMFMEKNQKIEKYHVKYPNLFNWRD